MLKEYKNNFKQQIHDIINCWIYNIEENKYALSYLIQWLFRSAIRDDKPINIYIPSRRMRELLISWLNE